MLKRWFGAKSVPLPRNRNRALKGFWWHSPPQVALAAGKGWNTEVVGESYRQEAPEQIVGGYAQYGCNFHTMAQLALPNDTATFPDAVAVLIDAKVVGFIPKEHSALLRRELLEVPGSERGVTCKAVIRGGWDETETGGTKGSFGVWLSLARPLKERIS